MKFSHSVKRAALAGVALCCIGFEVQADELAGLKQELASLQARVNVLEQDRNAASPAAPGANGIGLITFQRGSHATADWNVFRVGDQLPEDRGVTIAISPSADLPVPVHEVTVSGYVKGDVIYDFNQDLGDMFDPSEIKYDAPKGKIRLHARQTRFRVLSKSDTSIGQVRTMIEGDFFSGGTYGNTDFRLRHAWGEWDMTPNWTFGAGQTNRNFMSLITGINTVDFNGPAGLIGVSRIGQVRLTYRDGPHTVAFSIEDPSGSKELGSPAWTPMKDDIPDFTGRYQYDAPGGSQFLFSAAIRDFSTRHWGDAKGDSALGWVIQGGANINLADVATFSAGVIYGEGVGNYLVGNAPAYWVNPVTGTVKTIEAMGVFAGVGIPVTDATSVNFGWGWTTADKKAVKHAATNFKARNLLWTKEVMTFHGNVIWKPVNELQLGWEVIYGERTFRATALEGQRRTRDDLRAQFGAWFFF